MAGRKQKQKFTLKLNKQSFLKDTFPLQLFLLGSDFWLSARIREGLKGNLKAISFVKRLTARSTSSSLSPCDDSRDGFLLSFQDVQGWADRRQSYLKFQYWAHKKMLGDYHKTAPKQDNVLKLDFQHPGSWIPLWQPEKKHKSPPSDSFIGIVYFLPYISLYKSIFS